MIRHRRRVLLAGAAMLLPAGCAVRHTADGGSASVFAPEQLIKGDLDRVVEIHQQDVQATLAKLAGKLYRRNPRALQQAGTKDLETAVARIFAVPIGDWPELSGRRAAAAIHLAFRADYAGDRVAALMVGLRTMVDDAFEGKREFFLLDEVKAQKLYNCARNVEIAVWKLGSTRDAGGALLLLSNEIDGLERNLSFEREFGRIIGSLDVLARIVAGKNERAINRIVQNLATAVFLPVKELSLGK